MDSKIETIKNKIFEIAEKTGRIDEFSDITYLIDTCCDYLKQHKDILDEHAIIPDFDCPVCGNKVKVRTLYLDVKHYIEIAENISLPELFPLIGLFELMYHGLSFDAVTCTSWCLSCHKSYPIHAVSNLILSSDIKKLVHTVMNGVQNAN